MKIWKRCVLFLCLLCLFSTSFLCSAAADASADSGASAQANGRSIVVGPDGEPGSIPLIGPYKYPPVDDEKALGRSFYIMFYTHSSTTFDTYWIFFFSAADFAALKFGSTKVDVDGVTMTAAVDMNVQVGFPMYYYTSIVPKGKLGGDWSKSQDYGKDVMVNPRQFNMYLPSYDAIKPVPLGYFILDRSNIDIFVDGQRVWTAYPIEDQGKPLPPDGEGDVEQDTSFWGRIKKFFSGTWDTVTGWFSACWHDFLSWLKSFFVPADGYFDKYKQDSMDFLKAHFGFLYDVPDLLVKSFGKILSFKPSSTPSLVLPAVSFTVHGTKVPLWSNTVYKFDLLTQSPYKAFYGLYQAFVWVVFAVALLNLGIKVFGEIFGGEKDVG